MNLGVGTMDYDFVFWAGSVDLGCKDARMVKLQVRPHIPHRSIQYLKSGGQSSYARPYYKYEG